MIEAKVRKRLGNFQLDSEYKDSGFSLLSGPNGSGKTTFLSIIAGTLSPDEGFVKVGSVETTNLPIDKRKTVFVASGSYIPHLEVEKHLRWGAMVRKTRLEDSRVREVAESLGIHASGRVSELSLGTKGRVALATALLASPEVILVDEVFSGLDGRAGVLSAYVDLTKRARIDVIATSQDDAGFESVDHRYVISRGKTARVS
ncbi:MAG TPA: ATP-binding cassette domain-containing protein [Nitrososphaerales archaeon]|nr:ATP-binding cassette domain-containing protein [Nitrososphaerales archaeon]